MKALTLLLIPALLAACATVPEPAPRPETPIPPIPAPVPVPPVVTPEPAPPPSPPARGESVAVASLMKNARDDVAAGRLVNAAAALERALRIEPRNPRLWQELARVRLQQGQFALAESLAARSNSFAGDDQALRAENARIIAEAKQNRR